MNSMVGLLGLLMLGAFILLMASDIMPIVRDSSVTGAAQSWLATIPVTLYAVGAFGLVGAIFVAFGRGGRR